MNVILDTLSGILQNNARDGKDTVIIIDECHMIDDARIFEEMRLLLNFQLEDRFLLTLLLFGQPELRDKINSNKQFEQRIAVKCHLENLSIEEASAYIKHRLGVVGCSVEIFTAGALKAIHERTGGIPRRINRLCDTCLLSGMVHGVRIVDEKLVLEEAKELGG